MWRVPISIGRRLSMDWTGGALDMESVIGSSQSIRAKVLRAVRVAIGTQRVDRARRAFAGKQLPDQSAGDRCEAHAHHRMAGRGRDIREAREASDVGQA